MKNFKWIFNFSKKSFSSFVEIERNELNSVELSHKIIVDQFLNQKRFNNPSQHQINAIDATVGGGKDFEVIHKHSKMCLFF